MHQRLLFRFSFLTSFSTVFLLAAGALVTSTGSGLAVPDWPLSYGSLFPPMIGGILFEHGHRLVAGWVLILTLLQAFVFQKYESRSWAKRLAWVLLAIVLFQALLGGVTVLMKLPPQVSVAHACLAQLYFTFSVFLTLSNSQTWVKANHGTGFDDEESWLPLPTLSLLISILFFFQLFFGATMRHLGAGLAIPDFPTVFGGLLPPAWPFEVAVHFTHRTLALTLALLVAYLCSRIHKHYSSHLDIVMLSGAIMGLIFVQILLGAMIIWLRRPVPFTMLHLVTGALCLAFSVSLYALIRKHEKPTSLLAFEQEVQPV